MTFVEIADGKKEEREKMKYKKRKKSGIYVFVIHLKQHFSNTMFTRKMCKYMLIISLHYIYKFF